MYSYPVYVQSTPEVRCPQPDELCSTRYSKKLKEANILQILVTPGSCTYSQVSGYRVKQIVSQNEEYIAVGNSATLTKPNLLPAYQDHRRLRRSGILKAFFLLDYAGITTLICIESALQLFLRLTFQSHYSDLNMNERSRGSFSSDSKSPPIRSL